MPYMMHPRLYLDGSHAREHDLARSHSDQPRRIRMLFAGNYAGEIYERPISYAGQNFLPRA